MDNPYEATYVVRKKEKGEFCTLQRAAWKTNKKMDDIVSSIQRTGKFEDENWLVMVAR